MRPDLLTQDILDRVTQFFVKCKFFDLILGPALEGLKAIFQARPDLVTRQDMNQPIVLVLQQSVIEKYRHPAFELCISMFDANQDFYPEPGTNNIEERIFQFYVHAMKELQPAPLHAQSNVEPRTNQARSSF